jgi:hypothetical protein
VAGGRAHEEIAKSWCPASAGPDQVRFADTTPVLRSIRIPLWWRGKGRIERAGCRNLPLRFLEIALRLEGKPQGVPRPRVIRVPHEHRLWRP